jgi:hypothetical protein
MDKPHHPLVIRPWKTQQTQRTKWIAPPVKTEIGRFDFRNPKDRNSANSGRENSKKHA